MKQLFLILAISLFSITSFSQVTREGNTFKTEKTSSGASGTQTKYTWEDKEGNRYPIFITKKGACYVNKVSKKTNKEYRYYLPKEIQEQIKKELGYE